jgi:hypothetical protein
MCASREHTVEAIAKTLGCQSNHRVPALGPCWVIHPAVRAFFRSAYGLVRCPFRGAVDLR